MITRVTTALTGTKMYSCVCVCVCVCVRVRVRVRGRMTDITVSNVSAREIAEGSKVGGWYQLREYL